MKALMFYEMAPEAMAKVMELFPAHRALLQEFKEKGEVLMAGPYGNPPVGALGVFTSRQAAERFQERDPFVQNGCVARCTLHDWNEGLT